MTTSQTILVLAILLVWLAWRRARRHAQLQQALQVERVERNTFTLEPDDSTNDGFQVVTTDGTVVDVAALRWEEHGLELVRDVPLDAGPGARRPAPGIAVELIPEDDGAVHVWNGAMTERLGVLPAPVTPGISHRIDAGEVSSCVVLRTAAGGYDLLLVHADVDLEP